MFSFIANPEFSRTVTVVSPDGVEGRFKVKFRYIADPEFREAYAAEYAAAAKAEMDKSDDVLPLNIRIEAAASKIPGFWERVVIGWEGVDLPFSPENAKLMASRPWIDKGLREAYNATPEKN
jgi:hypothetical protein